jgi:Flp pilus assembly protein TadG
MQATRAQGLLRNFRGAAAVEFALILFPLLYVIGGAVDFGLAYFVSHLVQNAAREGARLAATLPDLQADDARVVLAVQSKLLDIDLLADFKSPENIKTTFICASKEVTVTVSGHYKYTFLRIIPGFTDVPMDRFVAMRYEQDCPE